MKHISDADTAALTAQNLLKIGAVLLRPQQPFTWASGMRSPIYCDNRLTLSNPNLRTYLKQQLASLVGIHFPHAEVIAGVATAGIPQGALVADALGLPFIYVRSSAKDHGRENLIEGRLEENAKVVVLEDLISTGGSCLQAVDALQAAKATVLGVVSIFTYAFPAAHAAFAQRNLPYYSLTDYPTLLQVAHGKEYINAEQEALLHSWNADPKAWSDAASN